MSGSSYSFLSIAPRPRSIPLMMSLQSLDLSRYVSIVDDSRIFTLFLLRFLTGSLPMLERIFWVFFACWKGSDADMSSRRSLRGERPKAGWSHDIITTATTSNIRTKKQLSVSFWMIWVSYKMKIYVVDANNPDMAVLITPSARFANRLIVTMALGRAQRHAEYVNPTNRYSKE